MNFKEFINYLIQNYKEKNCKCVIKGGNDPKFIIENKKIPYFKSNNNSVMEPFAKNLCKKENIADIMFKFSVFGKFMKGEINWIQAYLLLNYI